MGNNNGSIVSNIYWEFSGKVYNNLKDFRQAVIDYNKEIETIIEDSDLKIDDICINRRFITIKYDNEYFDEYVNVTLFADNGKNFTTKELLWKLHNWIVKRNALKHHIYFEGLEPTGELHLGS